MGKVFRNLYRAAIDSANLDAFKLGAEKDVAGIRKNIDDGKMLGLSMYTWEQHVFVYFETVDCQISPDELLPNAAKALETWPGDVNPRKWIPLIDIFHFNAPASLEHWTRKSPVEKHLGKIGLLKPEMIQWYMYCHYTAQEERVLGGGDKYQIIGINENIIFCYGEAPTYGEEQVIPCALVDELKTNITAEQWGALKVGPNSFIPWEDKVGTPQERLRDMDEVVSVW